MTTTHTAFGRVRKTTIDGKDFQIYILNASDGIKMARELSVILLPVIGTLFGKNTEGDISIDFKSAAQEIALNMDKIDVLDILKKLLKELSVDGTEITFDDFFAGNYGTLTDITAFALTENFSSFFSQSGIFQNLTKG